MSFTKVKGTNVKHDSGTVILLNGADNYKLCRELICAVSDKEIGIGDLTSVANAVGRYLGNKPFENTGEGDGREIVDAKTGSITFKHVWDDYAIKYRIATDKSGYGVKVSIIIDKKIYDGKKGYYTVSEEERAAMKSKLDEYANDLRFLLNTKSLGVKYEDDI